MSDPLFPDEPNINIWAIQNISDTKHDGLNWIEAQKTVPDFIKPSPPPLKEDDFLKNYLYNLSEDKRGCSASSANIDAAIDSKKMQIGTGILADYLCYCYVPLIHGEESNVSASGSRRFFDKKSVLETILDKENFKFNNIYLSKDFGFPSMQYDFTYFQKKKIYVGYTPAQENDAAGKPTLMSKKANEYGFFSPDINVDFIWTTVRSQNDTDVYDFPETTDNKVEKTCLNYRSEIQWDTTHTGNDANNLKSITTFTGENTYVSNSEWTSKSDKSVVEYEHFNNSAFSLLKKSISALCSPAKSALAAIQTTNFDLFHSLAKRSGDAFTAYIYDQIEGRQFLRRDKTDKVNRDFVLPTNDYAFLYQTHDRLAAAGALTRGCGMVILEHPRDDQGNSCFSLFFKKDLCDESALRADFIEKYSPITKSNDIIGVYSTFDEKIQKNMDVLNNDYTKLLSSLNITIAKIKSVYDTLDLPNIVDDITLVQYIRNDMLRNRLTNINADANTLFKTFQQMVDINVIQAVKNIENYPEISVSNYVEVKKQIDTNIGILKQFIDIYNNIQSLNAFFAPNIEEIKRNMIEKYHDSFETDAQKLKPFKTVKAFAPSSFSSRISRNLNPFKIFTEKKRKFLVVLDTELTDFGFPAFWLKYIDYMSDEGYRTINAVYQRFINAKMDNEQMKLIQKCLSHAFKSADSIGVFKDNLNDFADLKQTLLKQTRKEAKDEEDKFELELPAKLAKKTKKTKANAKKEEVTKTKIMDRCKNFLTSIIGDSGSFTGGGELTLTNKDEIEFFLKFCNLFVLFLMFTKIYQLGEFGYMGPGPGLGPGPSSGESDAIDKSINKINDLILERFPQKDNLPNEFKPMSFEEYINGVPYNKDKSYDFKEIEQFIGLFNNYNVYDILYTNEDTNKYEKFKEYLFPRITDITKNERYKHIAKEVMGVFIRDSSLKVKVAESFTKPAIRTAKPISLKRKQPGTLMSRRQSILMRMPGHISAAARNRSQNRIRIPFASNRQTKKRGRTSSTSSSKTQKRPRVDSLSPDTPSLKSIMRSNSFSAVMSPMMSKKQTTKRTRSVSPQASNSKTQKKRRILDNPGPPVFDIFK
jgi:hypothetical protein